MYDKLTKSDVQKMQEEIEYRKVTLRKQLLEDVKETRAHGDLSENFEYHAGEEQEGEPYPVSGENDPHGGGDRRFLAGG